MIRRTRGSALIEFVFFIGLWVFSIVAFVRCCRIVRVQQEALAAARWAAQLQSSGLVEPSVTDALLNQHFSDRREPGVLWTWRVRRFLGTPAAAFYRLIAVDVQAQFSFVPLVVKEHVVIQEATEL